MDIFVFWFGQNKSNITDFYRVLFLDYKKICPSAWICIVKTALVIYIQFGNIHTVLNFFNHLKFILDAIRNSIRNSAPSEQEIFVSFTEISKLILPLDLLRC